MRLSNRIAWDEHLFYHEIMFLFAIDEIDRGTERGNYCEKCISSQYDIFILVPGRLLIILIAILIPFTISLPDYIYVFTGNNLYTYFL